MIAPVPGHCLHVPYTFNITLFAVGGIGRSQYLSLRVNTQIANATSCIYRKHVLDIHVCNKRTVEYIVKLEFNRRNKMRI